MSQCFLNTQKPLANPHVDQVAGREQSLINWIGSWVAWMCGYCTPVRKKIKIKNTFKIHSLLPVSPFFLFENYFYMYEKRNNDLLSFPFPKIFFSSRWEAKNQTKSKETKKATVTVKKKKKRFWFEPLDHHYFFNRNTSPKHSQIPIFSFLQLIQHPSTVLSQATTSKKPHFFKSSNIKFLTR